jgi:energy-coupling factor transporter ATP-binding protein EcfA2
MTKKEKSMNLPKPIAEALNLPSGARFYRCALQVNPFEYVRREKKATIYADEQAYNEAMVQALKENGVEVIAITDHHRCNTGESLAEAAQQAGIQVFPGAELETKEGVHFLLLFEPKSSKGKCSGILGDCGIHDQTNPPKAIKYDVHELLNECESHRWPCVCIAAHVAAEKGLLRVLDNQARATAWKSSHLLACSLPGPITDAPDSLRPILQNKNPDYKRKRRVAIVNAQDATGPESLIKPGTTCWIKMSDVSVEGLRQAFLDPVSRIRLESDPKPEDHTEFLAAAWQSSGFLEGAAIHFNENLNVLIGGRGTGKSTIIESLRYVLAIEPMGEEAKKAHEGIVRNVLKSGTKISLLLRSHQPSVRHYTIERTVPNPPIVRDEEGQILNVTPLEIVPKVEVYGQHEISEITKSPEKLTRLLDRFVPRDDDLSSRKLELRHHLERSRIRLLDTQKELSQIAERLASLPALEVTLRSYQQAGLEDKLKEQTLLVREERTLNTVKERINPFDKWLTTLNGNLPIDRAFLSEKALGDLPDKDLLREADLILADLDHEMETVSKKMESALEASRSMLTNVKGQWQLRKQSAQAAYETTLRELQKSKIDGEEFIRLRRQIEDLKPLKEREELLVRDLKTLGDERRNLIAEWEDIKAEIFRRLERAAKNVSRGLKDKVLVDVTAAGNRDPMFQLLKEKVGGRLSETIEALKNRSDFSLPAFVTAWIAGKEELTARFALPPAQAERMTEAGIEVILRAQELELPPTTTIKLNVAGEEQPPAWQKLEDLSTGQKATAVLLLLLLESDAPLIVDQPEDDLDNRFITEGIVPKMRDEKRKRQFVFATHNANIPVLGDAELIVGLSAKGEAGQGHATLPPEHMGSIDNYQVSEIVKEVLEGGRAAFEFRRLKYGF